MLAHFRSSALEKLIPATIAPLAFCLRPLPAFHSDALPALLPGQSSPLTYLGRRLTVGQPLCQVRGDLFRAPLE